MNREELITLWKDPLHDLKKETDPARFAIRLRHCRNEDDKVMVQKRHDQVLVFLPLPKATTNAAFKELYAIAELESTKRAVAKRRDALLVLSRLPEAKNASGFQRLKALAWLDETRDIVTAQEEHVLNIDDALLGQLANAKTEEDFREIFGIVSVNHVTNATVQKVKKRYDELFIIPKLSDVKTNEGFGALMCSAKHATTQETIRGTHMLMVSSSYTLETIPQQLLENPPEYLLPAIRSVICK